MMRCIDEERLSFTEFLLDGNAYHWWMSILRQYGGHGAITWADFQREFTNKVFPIVYREDMMNEFMTLVQGSMIVEEYERKFSELLRFAQFTVPNESEKCRRFERGLREDISIIVIGTECIDFGTLVRVATRIERSRIEAQKAEP